MASFHTKLGTFLIFFLLLAFVEESFGQVLRGEPRVINPCVTEYTMGSATQDEYILYKV